MSLLWLEHFNEPKSTVIVDEFNSLDRDKLTRDRYCWEAIQNSHLVDDLSKSMQNVKWENDLQP